MCFLFTIANKTMVQNHFFHSSSQGGNSGEKPIRWLPPFVVISTFLHTVGKQQLSDPDSDAIFKCLLFSKGFLALDLGWVVHKH